MRGQNMDEVRTMQERGSIKACHHCHHTRHRRHLKHLLHQYHSYGSSWLHCGGCFAFERQMGCMAGCSEGIGCSRHKNVSALLSRGDAN